MNKTGLDLHSNTKQEFIEFYNSPLWRKVSAIYKRQQHCICERCHNRKVADAIKKGKKPKYIVHHKIHITEANIHDQDITLNKDNLQLLCIYCHNEVHGDTTACVRGMKFDANGHIIPE
jgi:hypothetical protein